MDSPTPILVKSYEPISFKPENLKQLERVYNDAKSYAENLARSENRQMSIPPPSPKAVLEEIARYEQSQPSSREPSRSIIAGMKIVLHTQADLRNSHK